MKRKTPAFKFIAIFSLAIVFVALLVLAGNQIGLRPYFESRKSRAMQEAYEKIDLVIKNETYSELETVINEYSESDNISIAVYDSYTSLAIVSSERDNEYLLERLQKKIFGDRILNIPSPIEDAEETEKVIVETNNYTITRNMRDLELFGYCSDNRMMVIMASPLEALNKNARQTTHFLIIAATIALIIGIVGVVFLTNRASKAYALEVENEKLQRQNEIQRQFVSNVSHELKTPITLIQGYAEGLSDGLCENEESRKNYCDIIVDETKRMTEIVSQLLMLSKIESGTDELDKTIFNFTELVSGIVENIKILADQRNATIEVFVGSDIMVCGDESKIESAVTNYISNAIYHVNDGGVVKVIVTTKNGKVHFSVINDGEPIPKEDLAHIWDKFYKVDKSHSRNPAGSGIGLSIVRAVIEAHNQKYGVINHQNSVEFWFELEEAKNDKQ